MGRRLKQNLLDENFEFSRQTNLQNFEARKNRLVHIVSGFIKIHRRYRRQTTT